MGRCHYFVVLNTGIHNKLIIADVEKISNFWIVYTEQEAMHNSLMECIKIYFVL